MLEIDTMNPIIIIIYLNFVNICLLEKVFVSMLMQMFVFRL